MVRTPSEGGQSIRMSSYGDELPATIDLAGGEMQLLTRTGREYALRAALEDLLAGSRSGPSAVGWMTMLADTRPSSTSWTDKAKESGSRPREKVRQACWSTSTSRTRRPSSARAAPSEATVVVLATPPFWLAMARMRVTAVPDARSSAVAVAEKLRTGPQVSRSRGT